MRETSLEGVIDSPTFGEKSEVQLSELGDLQLALVGGGVGETTAI